MNGDFYDIKPLHEKGLRIKLPVLDQAQWLKLIKSDPYIPKSYRQLRWLSRRLFDPQLRRRLRSRPWEVTPRRGNLRLAFEESGEEIYYQFYAGLSNPFLSPRQRAAIEADIDADTPNFENSAEIDHFILKWTNQSANSDDNIADDSIVTETGDFLETAWSRYHDTFDRDPYVPAGETKIEVNFHDIAAYGIASPPDGPIQFNSWAWVDLPGIRRPTSAHELFHKLQYSYGYRTVHLPTWPYKWFSEGTASWAEVFVWQRISSAYKLHTMFESPDQCLYDLSYSALPFWIFFQSRQQSSAADNPIVPYLQNYLASGDDELVLAQTIENEWAPNNVYRLLPHFFALFARERAIKAWKTGPSGALYGDILDADDNVIEPDLVRLEVPLGLGDTYTDTTTVSQLGSDYYRFALLADADGRTLNLSVDGAAAGDFSFYLVWEKDGRFTRAAFPFFATEDYSTSQAIDRADADSITLIISGRDTGGTYTLNVNIS